jgi:hypothetical protein
MLTNVLVQYQGGGYDGCIWEWNFFYIDVDGKFHDILSSGADGITIQKKADWLLAEEQDTTYIYDLANADQLGNFAMNTHGSLVKGIVKWFEENMPDAMIMPFGVCKVCESRLDAESMQIEDADIICEDCYCSGSCCECGEFVGENNLNWCIPDDVEPKNVQFYEQIFADENTNLPLCDYCLDSLVAEKRDAYRIELKHQALLTGDPDLFSEEMRWLHAD